MTEVMMGGAILAGVVLAGARMFKDQKMSQKKIENEASLMSYHNSLVKLMQNANNCNATLAGYYGATNTGSWANPTAIYMCSNCTSTSANYSANISSMPGRTPFASDSNTTWTDPSKIWTIEKFEIAKDSMSFGQPANAPSATGKAIMRVTYRLNPNLPNGGRRVSKDIPLNLRFSQTAPPAFMECISGSESSVNNLTYDICTSMTQVASNGTIMTWDDATQSCVIVGDNTTKVKDCPTGTMVDGIRSDGSVRCKAFNSGIDAAKDLMQDASCPAGSTVRLEVVNGKIQTLCY